MGFSFLRLFPALDETDSQTGNAAVQSEIERVEQVHASILLVASADDASLAQDLVWQYVRESCERGERCLVVSTRQQVLSQSPPLALQGPSAPWQDLASVRYCDTLQDLIEFLGGLRLDALRDLPDVIVVTCLSELSGVEAATPPSTYPSHRNATSSSSNALSPSIGSQRLRALALLKDTHNYLARVRSSPVVTLACLSSLDETAVAAFPAVAHMYSLVLAVDGPERSISEWIEFGSSSHRRLQVQIVRNAEKGIIEPRLWKLLEFKPNFRVLPDTASRQLASRKGSTETVNE